ncbi:MAG: hypothetical protein AB7G05_13735, partial [Hyphomonadaceae bacterium]
MTHDQATGGGAFYVRRGRAWLSLLATGGAGALFAIAALFLQDIGWRIALIVGAGMFAFAALQTLRLLSDKEPVLQVGPSGLRSKPFSNKVVPWADITEMARLTYFNQSVWLGRVHWRRMPQHDLLYFAVADPQRYPNDIGRKLTRAVQRMGGVPPIGIQLWLVDADPDAIIAEVRKYWRG